MVRQPCTLQSVPLLSPVPTGHSTYNIYCNVIACIPHALLYIPMTIVFNFFIYLLFIFVKLQLSHIFPSRFLLPLTPSSHFHSQSPPHCLCPWVLYISSLTCPCPFFAPLSPNLLPFGHCQFVLYFHVSGSILLAYLFC